MEISRCSATGKKAFPLPERLLTETNLRCNAHHAGIIKGTAVIAGVVYYAVYFQSAASGCRWKYWKIEDTTILDGTKWEALLSQEKKGGAYGQV